MVSQQPGPRHSVASTLTRKSSATTPRAAARLSVQLGDNRAGSLGPSPDVRVALTSAFRRARPLPRLLRGKEVADSKILSHPTREMAGEGPVSSTLELVLELSE